MLTTPITCEWTDFETLAARVRRERARLDNLHDEIERLENHPDPDAVFDDLAKLHNLVAEIVGDNLGIIDGATEAAIASGLEADFEDAFGFFPESVTP